MQAGKLVETVLKNISLLSSGVLMEGMRQEAFQI